MSDDRKKKVFVNKKMADRSESYRIKKPHMFDLPMRVMVVGKSMLSGKTNLFANLLLRPWGPDDATGQECYKNDFKGRNIYIVCPSTDLDSKWRNIIDVNMIPQGNIYKEYDEEELRGLYERIRERFEADVAAGRKPEHNLIVMDDISYSGDLKSKQNGVVNMIAMNGRHILLSSIILAQKYTDISTGTRENMTGGMFFDCSQKQLELIYTDHGIQEKKSFIKMFREATEEPHSYLVINYSNPTRERFMTQHFEPIDYKKY